MALFRSLRNNFYRAIDRLSIWLSYWKTSKKMYDFDYSSILEAEHHQLKRVIKSIDHYRSHVNVERDLFWMRICDYLLDVILNDVHTKWDGTEIVLIPYVNMKNYKRYFPNISDDMVKQLKYFPDDVYKEKAWRLYHRIREKHMQEWWD